MSALAMILTAAMVVAGDVPEKVSREMVQQKLDMRGDWEGTLKNYHTFPAIVKLSGGRLRIKDPAGRSIRLPIVFEDEGKGRVRICITHVHKDEVMLCIYRQEGDRFIVCFGDNKSRPSEIRLDDENQALLILHRVKSRK